MEVRLARGILGLKLHNNTILLTFTIHRSQVQGEWLKVAEHDEEVGLWHGVLAQAERGGQVEGGPQEVDGAEPAAGQLGVNRVTVGRHQEEPECD